MTFKSIKEIEKEIKEYYDEATEEKAKVQNALHGLEMLEDADLELNNFGNVNFWLQVKELETLKQVKEIIEGMIKFEGNIYINGERLLNKINGEKK